MRLGQHVDRIELGKFARRIDTNDVRRVITVADRPCDASRAWKMSLQRLVVQLNDTVPVTFLSGHDRLAGTHGKLDAAHHRIGSCPRSTLKRRVSWRCARATGMTGVPVRWRAMTGGFRRGDATAPTGPAGPTPANGRSVKVTRNEPVSACSTRYVGHAVELDHHAHHVRLELVDADVGDVTAMLSVIRRRSRP